MPRFRFSARFWSNNSNRQQQSRRESNDHTTDDADSGGAPNNTDTEIRENDGDATDLHPPQTVAIALPPQMVSTEQLQDLRIADPCSTRSPSVLIQSSTATEQLSQRGESATSTRSINTQVVTVLLRESDTSSIHSRLLPGPHHVIRRYQFIWSSDGTDQSLWSSPIRLRSYLSQFCTAMSRRVIPRGASIEVILYPHLVTGLTPGFNPMSITRIYCMLHPIHPPTSWQTQFPTDLGGTWSNFASDLGINALAGPLLDIPIPASLPNELSLQLPPPPLNTVERPNSNATDITSLAPNITEETPSPPLELTSSESLISSNQSQLIEEEETEQVVEEEGDEFLVEETNDTTSSVSNNSVSLPQQITSDSLQEEGDDNINTGYRFPDLPNKGNHDYNLFVPPSYVLGPIIGEGEFAKVRMACNLVTNGAVAIKAYRRRRGGMSSSIDEQMLREINVLKGLRCRNIVKVFETLVHGDRVFMVMEIMTKGDMRKYINRTGALKESNARKMFSDIINGVSYLHQNNIVHLDLKLENLLLNQDLVVKITDFGCARFQVGQKRFDTPCGSYAYGAPEVISGQRYNGKKADTWSLGVILYCMVSARLPYADDGQLADLMWERRRSPEIPSWVSLECCRLIRSALRYRPERRLNIRDMMSHPWMWLETRKLPWFKPVTLKNVNDFFMQHL